MRHSPYGPEIRALYGAALAIFTVTVVIGILNGTDLVDFGHNAILTHVHAGTLGWLTLGVMATTLWVFSEDGTMPGSRASTRWLARLAAVSIVLYIGAFYSGNLVARAVLAVPVLTAILWFLGWIWRASRSRRLSDVRLGIIGSVVMLLFGGTIGTLLQVQLATGTQIFPADADVAGAHVVAMVFSYLILFGMAVAEWQLNRPPAHRLTRGALFQIGLLVLAGILSAMALIFNVQALPPVGIALEIAAVLTFLARLGRPLLRTHWLEAGSARQFALSASFVVVAVALVVATIAVYIGVEGDLNRFPNGLAVATDHATFIGVMTNALFALLLAATERVDEAHSKWLAEVTFWGMNVGLAGFLVGLLADAEVLKQVFTPIMGVSILAAIVGLLRLLVRGDLTQSL